MRSQFVNTSTGIPISALAHATADTTSRQKVERWMSKPPHLTLHTYKQRERKLQKTAIYSFWCMYRFRPLLSLAEQHQRNYYKMLICRTWVMVQSTRWNKANLVLWRICLHSLNKGALGELAVQKDLIRQGYNVYVPIVDIDQVDLVVELNSGAMKRVQVKTVMQLKRGTAIEVNLTKYKNRNRIDVVAVYYLPKDIIAYYPYDNSHALSLAITTGKNNQTKGRKWFYSYERFPEFS